MEMVSIIVPIYNVDPYLPRCIDSLISQTYTNIEIILIDDCSIDNSAEIMNRYSKKDSRIRCFYHHENKGVSVSRNEGLKYSAGKWICFCDGDDWYDPDYVEQMITCAKSENADYLICDYRIVTSDGLNIVSHSVSVFESGCDYRFVIACGPTSSCTHMISRDLFFKNDIFFPERLCQYEELPVIPVLAKYSSKIGIVKDPLYNYFQRGDGSSASNSNCNSEKNFLSSWEIMANLLGDEYDAELKYHAIYALLYGEILKSCKLGDKSHSISEKIVFYEGLLSDYMQNPYLKNIGFSKKVFLYFCRVRCIWGLRLLSKIHEKIVG